MNRILTPIFIFTILISKLIYAQEINGFDVSNITFNTNWASWGQLANSDYNPLKKGINYYTSTVEVTNQGENAGSTQIKCFLSNDSLFDNGDILIKEFLNISVGENQSRTIDFKDFYIPKSYNSSNDASIWVLLQSISSNDIDKTNDFSSQKLKFSSNDTIFIQNSYSNIKSDVYHSHYNHLRLSGCKHKIIYTTPWDITTTAQDTLLSISSNDNKNIDLLFEAFKVDEDSLSIYSNNKLLGIYGGNDLDGIQISDNNNLVILRTNGQMSNSTPPFNSDLKTFGFFLSTSCKDILNIDEKSNNTPLSIYPNPANETIYIERESQSTLYLHNSLGQIILETNENSIDVSTLTKGIYYLKSVNTSQKVIVK